MTTNISGYPGGEHDPDADPLEVFLLSGPQRLPRHDHRRLRGRGIVHIGHTPVSLLTNGKNSLIL